MVINIDEFEEFNMKFKQKPGDINVDEFRAMIRKCGDIVMDPSNLSVNLNESVEHCDVILQLYTTLDKLLLLDFPNNEVQYVCGTALCSVINILPLQHRETKLDHIHDKLYAYMQGIDNYVSNVNVNPHCVSIMALINGVYHSNAIFSCKELESISEKILTISLEICVTSCMSYNILTSMSFRNMNSILMRIIDWEVDDKISSDLFYSILVMLYNNWENPITNVREMICKILSNCFQMVHCVLDHFLENTLMFPWNKGKYYTLCEMIHLVDFKEINYLFFNTCCLAGLRFSLRNQSLVTAGTALYRTLLDKYYTFDEWYVVFYKTILELLMCKERDVKRNILTYWMPMTIKRHPQVIYMLMNTFYEPCVKSDDVTYSFLFLLKLSRKSGHMLKVWRPLPLRTPEGEIILRGLRHRNEDIRIQAIQIVCSYSSYTILPTFDEIEIVKDFLQNNINCDSPGFRQNLVKCFANFVIILRDSFISNFFNKNKDETQYDYKTPFENFFVWIYEFIIENLVGDGNYQRKITSLQLFKAIMKYTHSGYSDDDEPSMKRPSSSSHGFRVVQYLQGVKKWHFNNNTCIVALVNCVKDAPKDVKDSAVDILVQHFLKSVYLNNIKMDLFISGIVSSNSKMFYEVDTGIALFKLLAHHDVSEKCTTTPELTGSIKVIDYFYKKISEQLDFYKQDIPYSIYNNQPLFGIMSAMNAYIKSPGIAIELDDLKKIVIQIEEIALYILETLALKSNTTDKQNLPSFSEINDSVIHLIENSNLQSTSENNTLQSNVCKMVMNNIWQTLKICCELSCTIITNYHAVFDDQEDLRICLNVFTSVLKRCRLKGAIEFAGTSLGLSVKFLTALKDDPYGGILTSILEEFLSEVTCEYAERSSITRRSAGLSILLHRLVANDSRPGKPLYYRAMKLLMKHIRMEQTKIGNDGHSDKCKDIPRATILHIMCRIINDSSLAYVNLQFLSRLTILCFEYINSEHWQIRNAALQLYGALVLRLTGQQQSLGPTGVMESALSADELFSHYPKLWIYVSTAIKNAASSEESNVLKNHSNLIPILSLLSHTGKRYFYNLFKFAMFVKCEKKSTEKILNMPDIDSLFRDLNTMLGSPIHAVRNLCAKIIESFYSADMYYKYWMMKKLTFHTENAIHGNMLVLRNYIKFHYSVKCYLPNLYTFNDTSELERMLYEMGNIIVRKNSSFFLKALYVETMFEFKNSETIDYKNCLRSAVNSIQFLTCRSNLYSGFHNWINVSVYGTIFTCEEDCLLPFVQLAMSQSAVTMDSTLLALKNRLGEDRIGEFETIKGLVLIFYAELKLKKENKIALIEIMYLLSCVKSANPMQIFNEQKLLELNNLIENHVYDYGYLLPLISLILTPRFLDRPSKKMIALLERITLLMKNLSNVDLYTEDNRMFSALTLQHMIKSVNHRQLNHHCNKKLTFNIKYNVITTMILLLQDEDTNVRNECSKATFFEGEFPVHPTRQLRQILSKKFFLQYMSSDTDGILKILRMLLEELLKYEPKTVPDVDLMNPFENDSKNTYWELELIKGKIAHLLVQCNPESGPRLLY